MIAMMFPHSVLCFFLLFYTSVLFSGPQSLQRFPGYPPDVVGRYLQAQSPHTSLEDLERFAQDPHRLVRRGVAINPRATQPILRALSQDPEEMVRWQVAVRENTPEEILSPLASDRSVIVRQGLTTNQTVPPGVLLLLAKNEEKGRDIYFGIIHNRNLTLEVCERILEEGDLPRLSRSILESHLKKLKEAHQ